METVISFAQFEEDIVVYNALKDFVKMQDVFYLDAGANDAIDSSVTFLFYLYGGKGINIEPQTEYKEKYEKYRSRDTNLFVAVSNKPGQMEMYGSGQAATLDVNGKYARGNRKIIQVETMSEICKKYVREGQDIHLFKIDVEGFEKECLEGMDFDNFRPWIICVESFEPGEDVATHEKWEKIILDKNYRYACTRGVNRFYCVGEKEDLFHILSNSKEIDKDYTILKMGDYEALRSRYYNSKAYKITKPLRKIKSVIDKVKTLR